MDSFKLGILLRSVSKLPSLECLNFGFDQLKDDCGNALIKILIFSNSLKSFELEGNELGKNVMRELGNAIKNFKGKLDYLGLSENPLTTEGLHILVNSLLGTENVKHLCLAGVSGISDSGLICCLFQKLLRHHNILIKLDLTCIKMNEKVGNELLKALQVNRNIQFLDCKGCDLSVDMQFEVELLLKRNHYIAQNSYIGDTTKTNEEINAIVTRIK